MKFSRSEPGPAARLTLDRPEALFLTFSLGFGLLFLFLAPPFQAPDEPSHFFRAWALSEGRIRSETTAGVRGAWIPVSLLRTAQSFFDQTPERRSLPMDLSRLAAALEIPLKPDERIFVAAPGGTRRQHFPYSAAGYTPAGYVGTSTGILIGRLVQAPPVVLLYAARLANLILATGLGWLAIVRAPTLRWSFAWALLLPMAVHLRSVVSIDAVMISLAFLSVAETLRALEGAGKLSPGIALGSAGWLCLVKPGYGLVPLLALALPSSAFSSGRRRLQFVSALFVVVLVGSAGSILFPRNAKTAAPPAEHVERAARSEAVRDDPVQFARDAAGYWLDTGAAHAREFVGNFGWLDTPVPSLVAVAALWFLVLLTQVDGIPDSRLLLRVAAVILFLGTVSVMTYHVHLGTQGTRFVDGIQGRYFLPLAPLAMVAIGWRMPLMTRVRRPGLVVAILSFGLLSLACVLLLQRHWL